MKKFIVSAIVLTTLHCTSAHSELESGGFQGLTSSSSLADVQKTLPAAKVRNCDSDPYN
ncbi:MAG: hypothetical protein WC856_26935 [Methylococcaceae bacterium]|jgi:hypothetical protein